MLWARAVQLRIREVRMQLTGDVPVVQLRVPSVHKRQTVLWSRLVQSCHGRLHVRRRLGGRDVHGTAQD